jgi:hypothetical protein
LQKHPSLHGAVARGDRRENLHREKLGRFFMNFELEQFLIF